jgi:hypothetical protein
VPTSLIAAVVLLTLFVPGYLFQSGVREFTNVLAAERDVYAVAQAVAISAGMLLAVLVAVQLSPFDSLEQSLLQTCSEKSLDGSWVAGADRESTAPAHLVDQRKRSTGFSTPCSQRRHLMSKLTRSWLRHNCRPRTSAW